MAGTAVYRPEYFMSGNSASDEAPCVVLIEDDPLVRLGQEMLLRDWGYRVITGASREQVFGAVVDARDVAAILSDFRVGGPETGAEVAVALSAAAGRRIPTALMSASLGRHSGTVADTYGFTFFAKPIDPERLRAWLEGAIAGGDSPRT
jgi:two-component system, sensor histidine kinase